jgi:hypothetical protein
VPDTVPGPEHQDSSLAEPRPLHGAARAGAVTRAERTLKKVQDVVEPTVRLLGRHPGHVGREAAARFVNQDERIVRTSVLMTLVLSNIPPVRESAVNADPPTRVFAYVRSYARLGAPRVSVFRSRRSETTRAATKPARVRASAARATLLGVAVPRSASSE